MSRETPIFESYVKRGILANNKFSITKVQDIESLKSIYFVRESYPEIERLIKTGNIQALKAFPTNQPQTSEYLEIMIFKDQNKKQYAVTVYDSNELWQDPQIMEIYSL